MPVSGCVVLVLCMWEAFVLIVLLERFVPGGKADLM